LLPHIPHVPPHPSVPHCLPVQFCAGLQHAELKHLPPVPHAARQSLGHVLQFSPRSGWQVPFPQVTDCSHLPLLQKL
jgi:hypothetical protein